MANWFESNAPGTDPSTADDPEGVRQQYYSQLRDAGGQAGLRLNAADAGLRTLLEGNNWDVGRTVDSLRSQQPPTDAQPQPTSLSSLMQTPSRQATERFAFDPANLGQTEGFKFNFDSAMRAIDRSAAARGKSFTNDTREELARTASGLASQDVNNEFNRQATTFGINADRSDTGFNQDRALRTDQWGREDTAWSQNRTNVNDQWGRGLDTWNIGRTNQNDQFDQNYKLSDLILARRPRPA